MFPRIARILPETASRDGTSTKRWVLSFGFNSEHIGANNRAVVLKVTKLGLLMQTTVKLETHDKLKVYLSHGAPMNALIVRRHNDHFDAVFVKPVTHSVLSALRFVGAGSGPILDYDDGSVARCPPSNRDLDPKWLLWSILVITLFIVSFFVFALASLPVAF